MSGKILRVFNIFQKLWEEHQQKQNDIRRKKLQVLHDIAYDMYYFQYLAKEIIKAKGKVHIPPALIAQYKAKTKASRLILKIEEQKRVDYFFNLAKEKGIRGCLKYQK